MNVRSREYVHSDSVGGAGVGQPIFNVIGPGEGFEWTGAVEFADGGTGAFPGWTAKLPDPFEKSAGPEYAMWKQRQEIEQGREEGRIRAAIDNLNRTVIATEREAQQRAKAREEWDALPFYRRWFTTRPA